MSILGIVLLFASTFAAQQSAHKQSDEIEQDELSVYLAKQFECEPDQIYFWSVDQYDFLGKGYDQAVVVASTCMTGTAGPDVHSVFTRDEQGEIKELPMQEVKLEHNVLFGNSNSQFHIEQGLLVDVYHDTSDRDAPLVIKYKWDGVKGMFAIVSVVAAKPYRTSYDCAKAEKDGDETGLAICYVETLADLDVDLAKLYKSYLSALSPDSRKAAIEEQRAWLKARNEKCTIYKWWVDCLTEAYNSRIAALKKKVDERKKSQSSGPPAAVAVHNSRD